MTKFRILGIAVLLWGACGTAVNAQLNFHFTFTGDSTTDNPGVGTVTGEIIGLPDNSTSAPAQIIIDSSPVTNIPSGYAFTPTNSTFTGTFQVADGVIVAASFSATSYVSQAAITSGGPTVAEVSLNYGDSGQNDLEGYTGSELIVRNYDGFTGATYTAATTIPTGVTIFCFGDSLSDIGNNQDSPYCNGVAASGMAIGGTWIQQFSTLFDFTITASSHGGTDYASGGAYTTGGNIGISMATQVNTYLSSVNNVADPTALYVFYGGSNDIIHKANPKTYAAVGQTAANNIMAQIEQLANAGAQNFLWLNMDALNVTPKFAPSTNVSIGESCVSFNQQWTTDMSALEAMYPTVNFVGYDFYGLTEDCYNNGPTYGFSNVNNPWTPGSTTLAYSKKSKVAGEGPDSDEFMFWDTLHPTTHFDQYLANGCFSAVEPVPAQQ